MPLDDSVQGRSRRLGNVEQNQRLTIHLAHHSAGLVRVQLADAADWRSMCLVLLVIGNSLKSEGRPERAEVRVFSVVLMNELPREEMRIGSGKRNMPRRLPSRAQNQLFANETGEVPIARVDRGTGGTAGTADLVNSVAQVFSPMDVDAELGHPVWAWLDPNGRKDVEKVLRT